MFFFRSEPGGQFVVAMFCSVLTGHMTWQRSGRGNDVLPRSIVLVCRDASNKHSKSEGIQGRQQEETSPNSVRTSHAIDDGVSRERIQDQEADIETKSESEDECGSPDCPCCASRRLHQSGAGADKGPCGGCGCFLCHERSDSTRVVGLQIFRICMLPWLHAPT